MDTIRLSYKLPPSQHSDPNRPRHTHQFLHTSSTAVNVYIFPLEIFKPFFSLDNEKHILLPEFLQSSYTKVLSFRELENVIHCFCVQLERVELSMDIPEVITLFWITILIACVHSGEQFEAAFQGNHLHIFLNNIALIVIVQNPFLFL